MASQEAYPRPDELEEHLDDLMEGGAEPPDGTGSEVNTNPNETEAEHEDMAIADAEHKQDPGEQAGGGQSGG